ncbi:protein of unknown function [Pararobbsia alpina]
MTRDGAPVVTYLTQSSQRVHGCLSVRFADANGHPLDGMQNLRDAAVTADIHRGVVLQVARGHGNRGNVPLRCRIDRSIMAGDPCPIICPGGTSRDSCPSRYRHVAADA